jgi:hypothetical protein
MTYANEYDLGRRTYHYRQEESLAFALSIVVTSAPLSSSNFLYTLFTE